MSSSTSSTADIRIAPFPRYPATILRYSSNVGEGGFSEVRLKNSHLASRKYVTWQMCWQPLPSRVLRGSCGRSSGERRTSGTEAWVQFPPSALTYRPGLRAAPALLLAPIHRSAWKGDSPKFDPYEKRSGTV